MSLGAFLSRIGKGDYSGHPFRGNQYVKRPSRGGRPTHLDPSTPEGRKVADENGAKVATLMRQMVGDVVVANGGAPMIRDTMLKADEMERALSGANPPSDPKYARFKADHDALNEASARVAAAHKAFDDMEGKRLDIEQVETGLSLIQSIAGLHFPDKSLMQWSRALYPIGISAVLTEHSSLIESWRYIYERSERLDAIHPPLPSVALDNAHFFQAVDNVVNGGVSDSIRMELESYPDWTSFKEAWGRMAEHGMELGKASSERFAAKTVADIHAYEDGLHEFDKLYDDARSYFMSQQYRFPTAGMNEAGLSYGDQEDVRGQVKQSIVDSVSARMEKAGYTSTDPHDLRENNDAIVQKHLDLWAKTANDASLAAARTQRIAAEVLDVPEALAANEEWRKGMYRDALRGDVRNVFDAWANNPRSVRNLSEEDLDFVYTKLYGSQQEGAMVRGTNSTKQISEVIADGVARGGQDYLNEQVHKDIWNGVFGQTKPMYQMDNSKWTQGELALKAITEDVVKAARSNAASHRNGQPLVVLAEAKQEEPVLDRRQRAVIEATYAHTQDVLRQAGIGPDDPVMLYRGAEDMPAVVEGGRGDTSLHRRVVDEPTNVKVQTNPLSSWATTPAIAQRFSNNATPIAAAIPARKIYSLATTGPGCLVEAEVVVIGGEYDATVFKGTS